MLIKSKELCQELEIHRTTLYRWMKKYPAFPAHRVGEQWRFDLDEIKDWMKKLEKPDEVLG